MSPSALFTALSLLSAAPSLYSVPMDWRTDSNEPVQLKRWSGQPVVLALVYTRCPSSCPLTLSTLERLQASLDERHTRAQFLIVTLDPEHDTPDALARFRIQRRIAHKNWTLLTGSPGDTRKLAELLDFRFSRNAGSGQLGHDNKMFILSRDGALLKVMSTVVPPIAEAAGLLRSRASSG